METNKPRMGWRNIRQRANGPGGAKMMNDERQTENGEWALAYLNSPFSVHRSSLHSAHLNAFTHVSTSCKCRPVVLNGPTALMAYFLSLPSTTKATMRESGAFLPP